MAVAAALARAGVFQRMGIVPVLLAASSSAFAETVVTAFEERVLGGRVVRSFMNAAELAGVFATTRLNFHPCEYDAYGMTVIEAASQGAPSVMHKVHSLCHALSGMHNVHSLCGALSAMRNVQCKPRSHLAC